VSIIEDATVWTCDLQTCDAHVVLGPNLRMPGERMPSPPDGWLLVVSGERRTKPLAYCSRPHASAGLGEHTPAAARAVV
jgi:hypothetical protein